MDHKKIEIVIAGEVLNDTEVVTLADEMFVLLREKASTPLKAALVIAVLQTYMRDTYGLKIEEQRIPRPPSSGHN